MRVISRKTLVDFYQKPGNEDSRRALESWFAEAEHAHWKSPHEIKEKYQSCSPIGNNRIVFNIGGNKYRLVVNVNYSTEIIYIRFVGTHKQYDLIDAEEI